MYLTGTLIATEDRFIAVDQDGQRGALVVNRPRSATRTIAQLRSYAERHCSAPTLCREHWNDQGQIVGADFCGLHRRTVSFTRKDQEGGTT